MGDVVSAHLMLGLLLTTGLLLGFAATFVGLPRVVAYVLAGILFSPSLLGATAGVRVDGGIGTLTATALGVIAYLIGGSITSGQLRRTGRVILASLLGEALGAALLVFVAMRAVLPESVSGVPALQLALAFGAIASTTAPAATIAVLHQYRARGPLSETLLGVVALDDAVGVILFALAMVASTGTSLAAGLTTAVMEIVGSLALGLLGALLLSSLARRVREAALHLPLVLSGLLLCIGVAESTGLSPLLSAMSLGFSARFMLGAGADRLFAPVEHLEEFVFLIFFTVAGAHFDARVLGANVLLMGAYGVARVTGKLCGASLGARIARAPPEVSRWLGVGLVPQAGVAVGLALTLAHEPGFEPVGRAFVNVILGTTIVYELIGPLALRLALARAGELGERRERTRP